MRQVVLSKSNNYSKMRDIALLLQGLTLMKNKVKKQARLACLLSVYSQCLLISCTHILQNKHTGQENSKSHYKLRKKISSSLQRKVRYGINFWIKKIRSSSIESNRKSLKKLVILRQPVLLKVCLSRRDVCKKL